MEAGAVYSGLGGAIEVENLCVHSTFGPFLCKICRACLGSEYGGAQTCGIELAEVWAKIGEHGGGHGCAGDALLCDEHGGVKVLDLAGGDGAEAGTWKECSEEGLDADIEGEVESL